MDAWRTAGDARRQLQDTWEMTATGPHKGEWTNRRLGCVSSVTNYNGPPPSSAPPVLLQCCARVSHPLRAATLRNVVFVKYP